MSGMFFFETHCTFRNKYTVNHVYRITQLSNAYLINMRFIHTKIPRTMTRDNAARSAVRNLYCLYLWRASASVWRQCNVSVTSLWQHCVPAVR